jgi:hypothetical protein
LRSDVVTLYGGYQFHLYRYKVYDDVRIVFAPEYAVGFFGGDPDNFEYPRYCLDMALLRVYENGKPARVEHFFTWADEGVRDGELVFVAGHPRKTERLLTASALKHQRDVRLPFMLEFDTGLERALLDYAAEGPEQARQATRNIFGTQNWLKVIRGQRAGLKDGSIIQDKMKFEGQLRERVATRPELAPMADVWDRVASAERQLAELHPRLELLEDGFAFWSDLFQPARTLVRLADEDAKPDGQRLPEFTQAKRAELELELFAGEPVYPELEIRKLTASLSLMQKQLGGDAGPLVKQVLAGKAPAARAAELVRGCKLASVDERRRLKAGGRKAIDASDDAMIRLAALVDPESRRLRAIRDAKIDEPLLRAYADLSRILFTLEGASRYPDATGTLRLSFGEVRGYSEDGHTLAAWTTIGQAFGHAAAHKDADPWKLPVKWHVARPKLAPDTPLDFVSTADIIGGNSGSPTFNRRGELVGLIFDGNRHSFTDDFGYTDGPRRAIHVDARGIRELLGKVYGADALLAEIAGKATPASAGGR